MCVCIFFQASGCFYYCDMGERSKPGVSKNSSSQVRILLSPQFFQYADMFLRHPGICCEVVCGLNGVCVHLIFRVARMFFLGDVGEWSKPRVCKTLYHKFESCHRLTIFYPVIFLRTSGLPIKIVVGYIFHQRCPDVFFSLTATIFYY